MHKRTVIPYLFFLQGKFLPSTLSVLFWLFIGCLAVFIYFFTQYLIQQHHQRIETAATISAKGLANVVDERIIQHSLMVKAIAVQHSESIYDLARGAGYPFNLLELSKNIKDLLPDATQFALLDSQGKALVGSDLFYIGSSCNTQIQHTISGTPAVKSLLGPHSSPNGTLHYDMIYPLERGQEGASLFLSFSFDVYKQLIADFNTDEFEFILVDSTQNPQVIASAEFIGDSTYGKILSNAFVQKALAVAPTQNAQWSLLGIPAKNVFSSYSERTWLMSLGVFITLLVLLVALLRYLLNMERVRKRLEYDSVQDALFNAGPTVLFQKKADSNMAVEYVSPNVHTLLGCTVQDVMNKSSFIDLILLEDVAKVRVAILNAFTHKEREVELEYRIKYSQYQGHRWVYDLTRIVYDQQGRPVRLQSYVTSIHAQKMAEQRANKLIENAPDAMAITDRYGVIWRVNEAFEKMFDYDRNDLIGLSLDLCIHEACQSAWRQRINQFVEEEQFDHTSLGIETSVEAVTSEGKILPVEVSFSRVDTLDGIQLVHMIRDISIQINAQKQMQVAKENAEALAKARSRFVATMSHEIRTPLNGVLGMSNLLLSTPLTAQQGAYLQAIEHSGQALLKIVNGILDFAKLDEGALRLESKEVDLNAVVRDCIQILQVQAQEGEVSVNFESRIPSNVKYMGDLGRIQQILLNLLSNAIKFSSHERVDITLKVEPNDNEPSDVSNVLIEVKDTGIGIAPESLDQLFDSFTQADDSTTRKFGGTGLGLAISKQLAELMGGSIGVVSELNVGSLFWVKIPLKKVPSSILNEYAPRLEVKSNSTDKKSVDSLPELPSAQTPSNQTGPNSELSDSLLNTLSSALENKTVLLIEDNEINQEVVLAFLLRLGARVDIAENGVEGLSFWRMHANKYDLILMDCQMPHMDGYEATLLIRKEEKVSNTTKPIPIVALTANAMPDDRKRCFSVGMNDYITKPIDIELFNRTLIKWIGSESNL